MLEQPPGGEVDRAIPSAHDHAFSARHHVGIRLRHPAYVVPARVLRDELLQAVRDALAATGDRVVYDGALHPPLNLSDAKVVPKPSSPTLLFLHGYGLSPTREYKRFLRELVGEHTRVEAPFIYNNNRLKDPPTTVAACIEQTRDRAADLEGPFIVVGHSTGAMVAVHAFWEDPRVTRIIACNPVIPVAYGFWEFVKRGGTIGRNQITGRSAPIGEGWRHFFTGLAPFYVNFLRKPRCSRRLVDALASYDAPAPQAGHAATPGRIRLLLSTEDEFFDYTRSLPDWLRDAEPVIAEVPARGHEWVIVAPRAAGLVREHLPPEYL